MEIWPKLFIYPNLDLSTPIYHFWPYLALCIYISPYLALITYIYPMLP